MLELLRLFPEENIDQQALCLLKQATEEHTQQNLSRTDKVNLLSFSVEDILYVYIKRNQSSADLLDDLFH